MSASPWVDTPRVGHSALSPSGQGIICIVFDLGQGHGMTLKFYPFATIQTVKSYISALAHVRKL